MDSGSIKPKFSELDNISVTAFRIISIINMLLKNPHDEKEINEELVRQIEGSRELSKDTICIYLNTLRLLGCEISRPTKNSNYKYVMKTHPFKISLTKSEAETLIEIKKYISMLENWELSLDTYELYENLMKYFDTETRNLFAITKKNFMRKEVFTDTIFKDIKLLEKYCKQNKILTLLYDSPESGPKTIVVNAKKITFENGAVYLWGYNEKIKSDMYLRIDRILKIKSVSFNESQVIPNYFVVKYKITGSGFFSFVISENESIIQKNSQEIIVKAQVTNKFKFIQKVLSYGSECSIIEPESFRQEILLKLTTMLQIYNKK
jgi:predicted DNA-binding transcriptional regulator YafY